MTTRAWTLFAVRKTPWNLDRARIATYSALVARIILRYGVVLLLLGYGAFKFTAIEAKGIEPLVASSPLMGWLYRVASVQTVSNLIGAAEIALALAMAARPLAPIVCALGSLGATITFAITLSFLATTPAIWVSVPGFFLPVPTDLGGFVLKDLMLLGASLWSFAEALGARSACSEIELG